MKKYFILLYFSVIIGICSTAQVSISPTFPKDTDSITVTFNASEGNKALLNLGPPIVYMHAGVVTDKSTSSTSWNYVQGNWGTADNKVVMTYMGNNIYQKKYPLRAFYGVPSNEKILRLAFVFRNVDGSKVGRSSDGSDIFIDLSQSSFAIQFITPQTNGLIVSKGSTINIKAETSEKASIKLYVNHVLQKQVSVDSIVESIHQANQPGKNHVLVVANITGLEARDSFDFMVNPSRSAIDPKQMLEDGVEFLSSTVTRFTLYAPLKSYVYVLGDFNNWQPDTNYLMHQTLDGNRYWLDVPNLIPGKEYAYQYFINGVLKVADPFSTKVLDPWNDQYIPKTTYPNLMPYPTGKTTDIVSVFTAHPTAYNWQIKNFMPPNKSDLVIYELLLRDFIAAHDFQTLKDSLDYLKNLGINAIELLPVSEFEGNESWGYNPSFHMALDKYYGTPNALKALVDACHERGIAVILDVVYNHAFSQSPLCKMYWDATNFRPASNSPYMNITDKHPYGVGYDVNHESQASQYWLDRVNRYWIEEYKVDGFRFDLSKGFTQKNSGTDVNAWGQYDASRIAILKRMANAIRASKSNAILILEHFAENSEEKELGANDFLLWNNMNGTYIEATMGYPSDFNWSSYKARGSSNADWVVFMESHDEERAMFKSANYGNVNGSYSIKNKATALERMALTNCFLMGVPGPKMIWQFGELGYDVSIEFNGRVGNKPIRWDYLTEPNRFALFKTMSQIIWLKTTYNTFKTNDFQLYTSGMTKVIQLNHSEMDALILGNFDVKLVDVDPNFQHTGWWYEYFTGDSINVTDTRAKMAFDAGEYRIYTTKKLNNPSLGISNPDLKLTSKNIQIFPNPSLNNFTLINKGQHVIEGELSILNISSQILYQQKVVNLYPQGGIQINHFLPPGMYTISILQQNGKRMNVLHLVTQ